MNLEFRIRGRVVEQDSGVPLPGLRLRAYDRDLLYDDLLGSTVSDGAGAFELHYAGSDFQELFDKRPDIYFLVLDSSGKRVIHSTADRVRWNAGRDEWIEVVVPAHKLPPGPAGEGTVLLDSQGRRSTAPEAGDSLMVKLDGLRPNQTHRLRLLDDGGAEVLAASLVSNRFGVIAPTVLWPDMGIGVPGRGGAYAFAGLDEAARALRGRRFTLEVLEGERVRRRADFQVAAEERARRLFPTAADGALKRGLLLGKDDLRVAGRNFPAGATVDLYLVKRRLNWRAGDAFTPARAVDGSELASTVTLEGGATSFASTLADKQNLLPGSYDVIARITRSGEYLRDERVLRAADFVSERYITTLVVRDDIFHYKPIRMGCVMAMREIAGKMLWGVPEEIEYTNNFPRGTDVWAALDPAGLMPDAFGKKIRYYVVQHKDAATWSADSSLTNVTGTTTEIITSPICVNANAALVWSNPMTPGQYDLVVDFGNNDPDPTAFVADGSFDPPLDMIDGYLNVGFYVTDDPSVTGSFAVGSTSYNDPAVTIPAVGVWFGTGMLLGDTPSGTLSLPMTAEVRYPADMAGANVPVSAAQASYPLVVIMHGMHDPTQPSYLGYNYLLDHLASQGFIAVSIDCNVINANNGAQDTRGHAILEHIALLNAKNNAAGLLHDKIDMSNIAIVGHSRGGDGVVQAEVLNQSLGLGWNIRAVVPLSPTDFSGTSPTPLVLSTSKLFCIYGSNDGDVRGGTDTGDEYTGSGFRFYDRATVEKAMVFIYGATHNRFNTQWGTEDWVDGTSPKVLSVAQHQNLLRGYLTAFLQVHLQGRDEQRAYLTGEIKIPQVSSVEVHTQYRPTSFLALDDYETEPALNTNSLGGTVSFASIVGGVPDEDDMATLDAHAPHQTRVLRLRWNALTASYTSTIPLSGTDRDLTSWKFLGFRVTQKAGSPYNSPGLTRDFRVKLTTAGGGNERAIRAGYFGSIPAPYKPEFIASYDPHEEPNTKSALKTVRIPLYAWTIKCLSVPRVDLSNVESVTFEFDYDAMGELEIDDIEFTG